MAVSAMKIQEHVLMINTKFFDSRELYPINNTEEITRTFMTFVCALTCLGNQSILTENAENAT